MTETATTTPIVGYLIQTPHGARWVPARSIESISIYSERSLLIWMRDGEELEAAANRVLPCRDWPDHTTLEIAVEWARQADEADAAKKERSARTTERTIEGDER
jgi:hypothetical protein